MGDTPNSQGFPYGLGPNRVTAIRNEVKTGSRRLRNRTFSVLEETFKVAAKVARSEIRC